MPCHNSSECGVEAVTIENGKNLRDSFFAWLAEEVPSEQRLNLYSIINAVCRDVEHFCILQKILEDPLFETIDLDIIEQVKNTVEINDLFRSTCSYSVDTAVSAIALYHQFLEERFVVASSEQQGELSQELRRLLSDDDMQQLRDELLKQNILTIEAFKEINPWKFMNRYALYTISQRQAIYKRILERLETGNIEVTDEQHLPELQGEESSIDILRPIARLGVDKLDETQCTEDKLVQQVEKFILDTDLDGIKMDDLCKEIAATKASVKRVVDNSRHIVSLGDKLFHDAAFVDWDDGADQMEHILDKLLDRNGGYVSATQLYEFARADMQMFLNDNDLDDPYMIYDMAQHLFEKADYHGKHLFFQPKSHISWSEIAITSNLDIVRHYARSQGGFFSEDDLIDYLRNIRIKTGNLRGQMRVYEEPIFLFYDARMYITVETMGIDDKWLAKVQKALCNLFADMGDHIVLRDIQPWWYTQLPSLPGGRPWTALLMQSVLRHYSDVLGGARTICGLNMQTGDTLHAMLVSGNSEIQTFPDVVAAFLADDEIVQRRFGAEELRQMLVQRGMIAGNELIWNMPKALAKDMNVSY